MKPLASISTDIGHDAFTGLRAFLDLAGKVRLDGAAVKWQFVGPVTLGVALHRAGLDRVPLLVGLLVPLGVVAEGSQFDGHRSLPRPSRHAAWAGTS